MLAELLLVLAGYPSAFFSTSVNSIGKETLTVADSLREYLHPGEVASLNSLAELAYAYTKVKTWAIDVQRKGREAVLSESLAASSREGRSKGKQKQVDAVEAPSLYLCTLAGSVLDALDDYTVLVVDTEARVLSMDPGLVQDRHGFVPLSSLVATFSSWQAPMAALADLVETISRPPESTDAGTQSAWTPGQLLDVLYEQTQTGNPLLRQIFTTLLASLHHLFLTHLVAFLLYGLAAPSSSPTSPSIAIDIGADALSPQHRVYSLNPDLLPRHVRSNTRESILYVGRVAATLRREGRSLPSTLVDALRTEVMKVTGVEDGAGLDEAIQRARADVGE
jgi:gamma-tubulin complex component 4